MSKGCEGFGREVFKVDDPREVRADLVDELKHLLVFLVLSVDFLRSVFFVIPSDRFLRDYLRRGVPAKG